MTCYVHKFDRISGRSTRSEPFVSVAEAARAIPMVAGIVSLRPDSEPCRLNDTEYLLTREPRVDRAVPLPGTGDGWLL